MDGRVGPGHDRHMESPWSLHPQLAPDTVPVGDLALARVLLANDANYPWLILVPRRPAWSSSSTWRTTRRSNCWAKSPPRRARSKSITECDKLNIAALGNQVPQLHVHVIARRHSDAAWPKPVWGAAPAIAYNETSRQGLLAALRKRLAIAAQP